MYLERTKDGCSFEVLKYISDLSQKSKVTFCDIFKYFDNYKIGIEEHTRTGRIVYFFATFFFKIAKSVKMVASWPINLVEQMLHAEYLSVHSFFLYKNTLAGDQGLMFLVFYASQGFKCS